MNLPPAASKRAVVRDMFDRIAPRYDLMNRLVSLGLDQGWRCQALDWIDLSRDDRVLDLACGTGDLCELAEERGARVIGVDFAGEMLRVARQRGVATPLLRADAALLPLRDRSVDVITCGFALRNFVSLPVVFGEFARVLQVGGRFAVIEVDRPDSAFVRGFHSLYFDRFVPWLGGLLSDRRAYRYLPESTAYLPPAAELEALISKAGFGQIRKRRLLLGAAQILIGTKE